MKIIRRSFGEKYALLELADGDYYHLPLDSKYIPSVDDDFDFNGPTSPLPFQILHYCDACGNVTDMHYYKLTEPHHLKEL